MPLRLFDRPDAAALETCLSGPSRQGRLSFRRTPASITARPPFLQANCTAASAIPELWSTGRGGSSSRAGSPTPSPPAATRPRQPPLLQCDLQMSTNHTEPDAAAGLVGGMRTLQHDHRRIASDRNAGRRLAPQRRLRTASLLQIRQLQARGVSSRAPAAPTTTDVLRRSSTSPEDKNGCQPIELPTDRLKVENLTLWRSATRFSQRSPSRFSPS